MNFFSCLLIYVLRSEQYRDQTPGSRKYSKKVFVFRKITPQVKSQFVICSNGCWIFYMYLPITDQMEAEDTVVKK